MPTSQFTIYTSGDAYGPPALTGLSGSLINVLDACLVNGYGSGSSYYKAPAGWTKPFPNVSASVGSDPCLACYKQASGSQFTLFVNDTAQGTGVGKEVKVTGWENINSMTGSGNQGTRYTGSNGVGNGYGQFPLPAQQLTYGFVTWRKSVTADSVGRQWIIAADDRTMYLWILSGDIATGVYFMGGFGDIFSLAGESDLYNCMIMGRIIENNAGQAANDWTGRIAQGGGYTINNYQSLTSLDAAQPGHYLARSLSGTGGSLGFVKKGDPNNNGIDNNVPRSVAMCGIFQTPNGPDNTVYIQPLQVVEPSGISIRGRLRGLYHPCHPLSNFTDGQVISAGGDYAGKTLIVIRQTTSQDGAYLLEISPTVETN